jgi:hypothetical protein
MARPKALPRNSLLVDWTARQIDDPLWRLRYLQAMAPICRSKGLGKPWKVAGVVLVAGLGLALGPLTLKVGGQAAAAPAIAASLPVIAPIRRAETPATPSAEVWQVEKTGQFETYSNGLRIDTQFAVSHHPRAFLAYPLKDGEGTLGEARTRPVGIVYHTTESLQAPFEPSQNNLLKRVGESLLDYVRRRRCYNYVIDRFGRVFRVVNEADAADHAGHSLWADEKFYYVNLNASFIGVSFEAQTGGREGAPIADEAQLRAAAMLTEMLRSRYKILAANCVTHAQVSVNPSNMVLAYHSDWASSFPFEKLGLSDNYATPSPAVWLFGFAPDPGYERRAGNRLAVAAAMGEHELVERARADGLALASFRKTLHKRFKRILATQRSELAAAPSAE